MDFERLRLPQEKLPKQVIGRPKHPYHRRAPFLKGPVQLDWLQEAMQLGIGPLSVGIILWYFMGLKKTKSLKVGIADIANLIKRSWRAAQRSLKILERQGLITLERHPGRKHLVTIQDVKENDDSMG